MGSFSNLMRVFADSSGISDPALQRAVGNILAMILSQSELRFFVDGTPNCGHQGATVQLVKRLIDMTGFAGRITIVYADIHKGSLGRTADKLALLLPHLDPRRIDTATLIYGTCQEIRFLDYDHRSTLDEEVRLGFTAAADDMRINFAAELKVKYFVRLQPYLWENDPSQRSNRFYVTSRIETADGKYFCPVENHPAFRSVPYRYSPAQCESIDEMLWNWYGCEQTFDPQLAVRTQNARAVCRAPEHRLRVWPIYGLHHFRENVAEMAMNLIVTAVQVQQAMPGPILALVMNAPWDIPQFEALVAPLARDLEAGSQELERVGAALAARYHERLSDCSFSEGALHAFQSEFSKQIGEWRSAGGRVMVLPGHDESRGQYIDISDALRKATTEARDCDVIVSVVGPVPGDVYNYLYAHSRLPGIFEGANSLSLTVSLGRPYLQMPRESAGADNPYPLAVGGADFAEVAGQAHLAALQLTDQRCDAYLQSVAPTHSEQYFAQLRKISEFILATQDETTDISRYFRALKEYYQDDAHDKCLLGLMALALSAPEG